MRDVFACYLTSGGAVEHSFMVSMTALLTQDSRITADSPFRKLTSPGGLADSRNQLTAHWLDHTVAKWMWMVDTDMGFMPDTLDRLLLTAHRVDRPVVGALCFALVREQPDGRGGYTTRPQPTIYGWDGDGFKAVAEYRRNDVMRVGATGAACLLIHRDAAESVRAKYGDEWWLPVRYPDGRMLGEDLSFCYRLAESNIPVHVDTSVRTTHAKTVWVGEDHWLAWRNRHG